MRSDGTMPLGRIAGTALLATMLAGPLAGAEESRTIVPLEGAWRLVLDPQDVGVKQKWFAGELKTTDTVQLPGSLQAQGYGEKPSSQTKWNAGWTVEPRSKDVSSHSSRKTIGERCHF